MDSTSKSSGILAVGTHNLFDGTSILTGVNIVNAAADVTVVIYDALTATSTEVFNYTTDFSYSRAEYVKLPDIKCKVGLTAVISGTGGQAIVHYK